MVKLASFSDIASNPNFILSTTFFYLNKQLKENDWFLDERLATYFDILSGFAFKSEDYEEEGVPLLRIGDIKRDGSIEFEDMNYLPVDYKEKYKRFLVNENDIAIAMTGATIGKTGMCYNLPNALLLNQRVGLLRKKKNVHDINPKFVYYLLCNELFLKQIYINSMGKSQPNISPFDILKLRIPKVNKKIQDEAILDINLIETEINLLKIKRKNEVDIINEILNSELSLDIDRFNDLKEKCRFYSTLEVFSNNKDLRCSYKFHNEANLFLTNFLNLITNKKIKDFISEPIVLGKGITPSQYDDEGSYYYLAMSNIKKWKFDIEDCKKVGKSFYDENSNKTIQLNDILLARSGEGTIGKVAIIEDDEVEGIFADFTMRIRLKDYNPTFAYYYFRSDVFQYLVYTHKKGLGNNTNIFPSQVQEFPLLDFTKEHQNRIVKEVQKQLKDLEFVNDEIEKKRNEILKIVQKAITPNK